MANNLPANPKLLKIFTPVRCLNRDQLPRYIEGKLTDLEKHLVEQHLVDCDLCSEALHVLENETHRSRYATLVGQLHQYIRVNIKPESQVKKKETAIRKERTRESLLAIFWIFAFVIIIAGSVFVYRGFMNEQANTPAAPVAQTAAPLPANTAADLQHPAERRGDTIVQGTPVAPVLLASGAPVLPVAAVVRDSIKKAPIAGPVVVKKDSAKVVAPPVHKPLDSAAKAAAAAASTHATVTPKAPDTAKKATAAKAEPPAPPKEKPAPVVVKKEEDKKPEPAKKKADDDDKKTETPKKKADDDKTVSPSSLDEFMYKAARVSQQEGDLNEAINRYRNLASTASPKYAEMAKYQIAQCYKAQGHHGKAKRMFKEVIKMNGSMKNSAQQALDADKSTEE